MSSSRQPPTFSVIIPTFNRAHLLPRAIRSVLAQTFQDYELIVADDASTDQTWKVMQSFTDQRINYIRRTENGGNAATRNTGVLSARGKYVCFLDDDDEYLPDFLEATRRAFDATPQNVGLSWCGVRYIINTAEGERVLREGVWQPKFDSREQAYLAFLRARRVGLGFGVTIRKTCFDAVGLFDESLRVAVDTEFFTRLVRQFDFVVVPTVHVKLHRHHGGPRVKTYSRQMAEAYERIIAKNHEHLRGHNELYALLYYKTGWLYYHAEDRSRARRFMRQALQKNPLQVKAWLALLLFEVLGSLAPRLHKHASAGLKWLRKPSLRSLRTQTQKNS